MATKWRTMRQQVSMARKAAISLGSHELSREWAATGSLLRPPTSRSGRVSMSAAGNSLQVPSSTRSMSRSTSENRGDLTCCTMAGLDNRSIRAAWLT